MESELEKIAYVYGDICVRTKKQRRKRQKLLVIDLLYDYAKNSTLHGLRYIVDRGLSIVEKLFWFVTVFVSIALCSYYINNLYWKWKTSPVIVTVNERQASVGTVPFPAVTICPQIKVKPKIYNYTNEYHNYINGSLSEDDVVKFQQINTMCEPEAYIDPRDYMMSANESIVKLLTEVAPSMEDIFLYCSWYNSTYATPCENLFSRVYTEEGVCYTANSLMQTEIFETSTQSMYKYLESNRTSAGWSLEKGYDHSYEDHYPRKGRVLGSVPDLEIVLISDPDDQDESCNGLYSGFTIYLHHPADFPQTSLYYYAALPNHISSVAINFHQFNTDISLSSYPFEIRQCYFPNDRKLRYFKIYTAKNCQAECLSNYTLDLCNCVGFYMPHNDSSQICPPMKEACIVGAKDKMAEAEINEELGLDKKGCNCLPACNTIEYDAEILKTDFKLNNKLKEYSVFNPKNSYSRVDLFFKKPQFVTMQRRELFGVTDLLANIGGLLGVFLGFSFLSLIEIFYFLTLRVGFTLKRDLEEEKKTKKAKQKAVKTH